MMPLEYRTVIRMTPSVWNLELLVCFFFSSWVVELPQTPTELRDSHKRVMPLKTADAEHKTGHGESENKSTQWDPRTHMHTGHGQRKAFFKLCYYLDVSHWIITLKCVQLQKRGCFNNKQDIWCNEWFNQ